MLDPATATALQRLEPSAEMEKNHEETSRLGLLQEKAASLGASYASPEETDVGALLRSLSRGEMSDRFPRPPDDSLVLLRLVKDPTCGPRDLAYRIEADPGLSSTILTHAGSAYYGTLPLGRKLSVALAVQRIGMGSLQALITSEFVRGEFLRPGPGLDEIAQQIWDHMVRTGPVARRIARRVGINPDSAFTLGLLHDVGKLAVLRAVSELRRKERRDLRFPNGFIERALNDLHELLGAEAVSHWGFDESAADVIATHHRRDPVSAAGPLTEAIYLAERLDLAAIRERELDRDVLWADGDLTLPRDVLEGI